MKERKIFVNGNLKKFLDIFGVKEIEGDKEEEEMLENFEGLVEILVEENIFNLFDLEDDEDDEDEDKENLVGKFSSLYLN